MIKIYGLPTCPYCDYIHKQIEGREDEFEYINIGEHISNLSKFIKIRDNSPVFNKCKRIGDVGIPAFVFDDGRVTINPEDVGLIEYNSPISCSIDDHKKGKKNCWYVKIFTIYFDLRKEIWITKNYEINGVSIKLID